VWYRVKLRRVDVRSWKPKDAVVIYDIFRKREVVLYYGEHWIATEKKQCNHDELKEVERLLIERAKQIRKM
jgi:hypothetical protein